MNFFSELRALRVLLRKWGGASAKSLSVILRRSRKICSISESKSRSFAGAQDDIMRQFSFTGGEREVMNDFVASVRAPRKFAWIVL